MKNWTNPAKTRLEDYFARMRSDLRTSGADVEEVTEDLRRHVEQEVQALKLGVVTEQDVGNILRRLGVPETSASSSVRSPAARVEVSPEDQPPPESRPPRPGAWLFIAGVVLPLATIVFEYLSGICAAELFDPYPSFAHIILTLLVPATNLWVWLALRGQAKEMPVWMGWALGLSFAVSAVYGLLLLPFAPFACIGVLVYGLGLIPLAPYFGLGATLALQSRLSKRLERRFIPGFWRGVGLGTVLLLALTAPLVITRVALQMTMSDQQDTRMRGIALLRSWGAEDELLRACYGRVGRPGELYSWGKSVRPEEVRKLYYQVRGRAFNSVPPPKLYSGRARWTTLEREYTWDEDQGGDAVAGRIKGLSLATSRQDIVVDPAAALAYMEWTVQFKNVSPRAREARAQVLLPPGAVVSRLTLWIDGEEREAAFGGRSQVKQAYKQVVLARRDPVLVTTAGPDRVLVQCFPVPASGGVMKARIGITAPLVLTNTAAGLLRLPAFIERNFNISDDSRHLVWIDSPQPLSAVSRLLVQEKSKSGQFSLRGALTEAELASPGSLAIVQREPQSSTVWTRDTRGEAGFVIKQTLGVKTESPANALAVVIDGGIGMGETYADIASQLASLPVSTEPYILLAQDGVRELTSSNSTANKESLERAAEMLRRSRGYGGQDNVPALLRAWDRLAQKQGGTILWIHGPQPEPFDSYDALSQRFERRSGAVDLISLQTRPGPNRLIETLDGMPAVHSEMRTAGLAADVGRVLATLTKGEQKIEAIRARVATTTTDANSGPETSLHLARLWAHDQCLKLHSRRNAPEAMRLAALYQLVTPVSGAVVLETKEQYARAGLEAVPPSTVPIIPEPNYAKLLLVGAGVWWLLRKRFPTRRFI